MSESEHKINCKIHGESAAAFVCQHLGTDERLGFNLGYDPDLPDDTYPDAWCDECEILVEAEGEWNDASLDFCKIKVLCCNCYEDLREKNWIQDDESNDQLIKTSFQYLQSKQNQFADTFKINDHERWDWTQETGLLIFTHNGIPQVEAEVHFSGSYSTRSKTWMWAWANTHFDEKVKSSSRQVKTLGEDMGLLKLSAAHWSATEIDGWEMTSILAKEINAIGAYRTPSENGFTYMVVTKAKWLTEH